MVNKIISILIKRLTRIGIDKNTINKLLSSLPIKEEETAFIILNEVRKLNPQILIEKEYGGLNTEPVYATMLSLGDKLVIYMASSREHEIRLLDNTMYIEALWIIDEFIKRNAGARQ